MENFRLNHQFLRQGTISLDGSWHLSSPTKEIDGKTIEVPYCIESSLGGVGYTNFVTEVSYQREFVLSKDDLKKTLLLRFGAVDYEAGVYVNDAFVGKHVGGYTEFVFDITSFVKEGVNSLRVDVKDDCRLDSASGKQSYRDTSFGCFYTRTTGIWRSVTLDKVPSSYLQSIHYETDVDAPSVKVNLEVKGNAKLDVEITYEGRLVGESHVADFKGGSVLISLSEKHLWEIGNGRLYDVRIVYGEDVVTSYFGLRSIEYRGHDCYLNGKKFFQMLVLDQGFYPEGIYTPKSQEQVERDIDLALSVGFNGARLHQKVFDHAYLEYADRKGFLVWQEYPSWGIKASRLDSLPQFKKEWAETMRQTYNHPSIIMWCPLNEAWADFSDNKAIRDIRYVEEVYKLTKSIDSSRPCVDTSGGLHGHCNDVNDFHCYFDKAKLKPVLDSIAAGDMACLRKMYFPDLDENNNIVDANLPMQLSEYGGMSIGKPDGCHDVAAWGYTDYSNNDTFVDEYVALTEMARSCPVLSGACYTQLYDIEQEQNGLFTYEREPKLTPVQLERIKACNEGKAK